MTVGHLKLESSSRVWLSLFQALLLWGRHIFENVFLSKAETEMYSWVGSSLRLERASGTVPFETRNVVKSRL